MLISIDWIKDFVDLDNIKDKDKSITKKEIQDKVTITTAEVEEVNETVSELFIKVRVVEIKSIKRHPDAEKLNLVTFSLGSEFGSGNESELKEVVCGAANVRVGLKVPYAPLGSKFPDGLVLEAKKIRGVVSCGMLCSSKELGLGENSNGLLELPEQTKVGITFAEYLGEKSDVILNIDNKSLTHRPDLWGHFGMAREIAAMFETPLKNRFSNEWEKKMLAKIPAGSSSASGASGASKSPIKIYFEGESAGLSYYGLSVSGVKIAESPEWMKRRLKNVGLRAINNIVDISNYVMLELGIPLHIFDRDLINDDKVIIRRVGGSENILFKTLDEIERELIPTDTIIANSKKPLVVAGIMGGLESGVNDNTTNIFIEVANWKAALIRRTSTRLGLRTESSQRYEKSLDSMLLKRNLLRTLELVLEFCPTAKVEGGIEYAGEKGDLEKAPLILETSAESISKQLGQQITLERMKEIFEALEFQVGEKGREKNQEKGQEKGSVLLEITVPSFRATKDIDCEADLVEEIGRMIGYDTIKLVAPTSTIKTTRLSYTKEFHRQIQDFFVLHGKCLEIFTYPLVGERTLKDALWDKLRDATSPHYLNQDLVLINALSKDHDRMRPSLIPSLLEAASLNQKYYDNFRLFEIGRFFDRETTKTGDNTFNNAFVDEKNMLGLALFDKQENMFIEAANLIENLFKYCKLKVDLKEEIARLANKYIPVNWPGKHPKEFLNIMALGKIVGGIVTINPFIYKNFKMKGNLTIAVVDLSLFEESEGKQRTKINYKPIAKYPSATFDCTVIAESKIYVAQILDVLKKMKMNELVDCKIVDIFPMNNNKKAVTVRNIFLDELQTLESERIKKCEDQVVATLAKSGFPLKV
ncbi:MAG: phenylalanine--tRNA ligase subunit beta [Oligoflexia bacterium]|nr:phenylalanine--tRNA ligase subunit beta [Oligoflexia bacterium]